MNVKSALAALVALFVFSLPVSATYIQVIDDFESGSLGSWSVENGVAADTGSYNAIFAHYSEFIGPIFYYPPQGNWMMVLNGGEPRTAVEKGFTAYSGAQLLFSWFFATLDAPAINGHDDSAGFSLNGDSFVLARSSTTGYGVGGDNTGWIDFSIPLPVGPVELGFWAENIGDYLNDPRLAIDNIRVTYADGIPPELTGGGGVIPSVPEPSTVALLGVGLLGLSVMKIRRREAFATSA